MGHLTYGESKKRVTRIIIILGIITFCEVVFALYGKGHIVEGKSLPLTLVSGVMIAMSIVKAYLIVYEFMHMKYEVPALVKSVLLPTLILVWAIIAFFYEGRDWRNRRELIDGFNNVEVDKTLGSIVPDNKTKNLF